MKKCKLVSKERMLRSNPGKSQRWASSGYSGTSLYATIHNMTQEQRHLQAKSDLAVGLANINRIDIDTWPMGMEAITYTTGHRNGMNNCAHLKQQMVQLPVTAHMWYNWSFCRFYGYYRFPLESPYWKDALFTALQHERSSQGFDDQQFSARAYWSMRPKWKGQSSLINSIFELKDFSDVVQSIPKLRGCLSDASVRNVLKQLKQLKRATGAATALSVIDAVSKLAASAVLTWNLAIKPTIQDVATITADLQKDLYDEATKFQQLGEEGARSHYSEHATLFSTVKNRSGYAWSLGDGKHITYKRTATAITKYRLLWERLEDSYPRWWGLEIGADEVWNMLPLSFVLDYIFTIGKTLDYMDRDDKIEVQSVSYCETIKIEASMGTYVMHDSYLPILMVDEKYIPSPSKPKPLLVTGTIGKVYRRKVMEPYCGPALPFFKVPSVTQGTNMLALARCFIR